MKWAFFQKRAPLESLDKNNIPQHVAIIMDGNGRWAQRRGLPREAGHAAGEGALRNAVEAAVKTGVRYLTVYAFSTENWNRPQKEIAALMNLLKKAVKKRTREMCKNDIKVQVLGRIKEFGEDIQKVIREGEEQTKNGNKLILTVMLNYGGRAEIVDAVKNIANKVKAGKMLPEEIDEKTISDNLYTREMPEPDLLIRTSGEQRISNYLLWQCAYTEFYFTKTLWPDFTEAHFYEAVAAYQKRNRRKGDISCS